MTKEEMEAQADQIVATLTDQIQKASDAGDEQLDHYLWAAVYTIGASVPSLVKPENIGEMTMRLIDALTQGIERGAQMVKLPGELTIVRRTFT